MLTPKPVPASRALKYHFSKGRLLATALNKISVRPGKGIDRKSPSALLQDAPQTVSSIQRKVRDGCYRFSPYLEILRARGSQRPPRVISFPTARDRLVLHQLKEALHAVFPEHVPRTLPNKLVRDVVEHLSKANPKTYRVLRADIADFYPSIKHDLLIAHLKKRIRSKRFLALIQRAITTRTVPINYRKKDYLDVATDIGIPQGLAISNILANLYLSGLDAHFDSLDVYYARYVDDIIIIGPKQDVLVAEARLKDVLQRLGLRLGEKKSTGTLKLTEPIEFLGYRFEGPKVSVRQASVERLLASIAAFATTFTAKLDRLERLADATRLELMDAFIEDINEKITGSIHNQRRYGWIFYYLELNDITLLHQMDAGIRRILTKKCRRLGLDLTKVKRIVRAYYEAKYTPTSGYINDYARFSTVESKRVYLRTRGVIHGDEHYSDEAIAQLFDRRIQENLDRLDRDIGRVS